MACLHHVMKDLRPGGKLLLAAIATALVDLPAYVVDQFNLLVEPQVYRRTHRVVSWTELLFGVCVSLCVGAVWLLSGVTY